MFETQRPRRPNAALRRAARERDKCRCRFPGCESRRVDLHHIQASQHDTAPPPAYADQDDYPELPPPRLWAIEPQDWMPSLRYAYTTG